MSCCLKNVFKTSFRILENLETQVLTFRLLQLGFLCELKWLPVFFSTVYLNWKSSATNLFLKRHTFFKSIDNVHRKVFKIVLWSLSVNTVSMPPANVVNVTATHAHQYTFFIRTSKILMGPNVLIFWRLSLKMFLFCSYFPWKILTC